MLRWLAIFLSVAVLAAVFGIGGITGDAVQVTRTLLVVFLVVIVGLLLRVASRRAETPPEA